MAEPQNGAGFRAHLEPRRHIGRRGQDLDPERLVRATPCGRDVRAVRVTVLRKAQVLESGGVQLEHLMLGHLVPEALAGRNKPLRDQQAKPGPHGVPRRVETRRQLALRGEPRPGRIRPVVDFAAQSIRDLPVLRLLAHASIMTHSLNLLVHVGPDRLTLNSPLVHHHCISLYQQVEQAVQLLQVCWLVRYSPGFGPEGGTTGGAECGRS